MKSESQSINVSKAGSTIKDIALNGAISVEADNTTIEDSEITVDGTQTCGKSCGGRGIWIKPGVTGTVIKNVTCHGGAANRRKRHAVLHHEQRLRHHDRTPCTPTTAPSASPER